MRVKIDGKVISTSFLKIEGRGTLVGAKDRKEGQIEELVDGQNPGPKARKGKRGGSKGDVRGVAMEKGGCVRVIEWEEVRRDDPVEYFIPAGTEVPLESQRG